jgi:hypothetical protein
VKKEKLDLALGIVIILGIILICWRFGAGGGLVNALIFLFQGTFALYLWHKGSLGAKIFAGALLPAILLRYLLPKKFRFEIASLQMRKIEK